VAAFESSLYYYRRAGARSYRDGKVIADSKVVTAFNDTHVAQMLGYLNIMGLEVALLLNFRESKPEWQRVVRGKPE
jgi:GxxExxY protein